MLQTKHAILHPTQYPPGSYFVRVFSKTVRVRGSIATVMDGIWLTFLDAYIGT